MEEELKSYWAYVRKRSLVYATASVVVILLSAILLTLVVSDEDGSVGEAVVKAMYNFKTVAELDDNMEVLKDLVSGEVYDQLTFDRTDRALQVYLKFSNSPVRVVIEETTADYVIYSLDTTSISAHRKFVLFYKVDKGKVVYARESEIIDFTTNAS